MRSSIFFSLAVLAASLGIASARGALGINCRGSSLCHSAKDSARHGKAIIEAMRDAIVASHKPHSTVFNSGDHVACDVTNICLFPQGAALTLGQVKPLIDALIVHKCGICGSVPVHFVDQGGNNDPTPGILTFNYVRHHRCEGQCIPVPGDPDPTPPPKPPPLKTLATLATPTTTPQDIDALATVYGDYGD